VVLVAEAVSVIAWFAALWWFLAKRRGRRDESLHDFRYGRVGAFVIGKGWQRW
jgi:hypothetical protein